TRVAWVAAATTHCPCTPNMGSGYAAYATHRFSRGRDACTTMVRGADSLMFLHRIVAFPESRRILRLHLVAQVFLAVEAGVFTMIPVLLRGRFAASEWQTMLATASQAFMAMLAIFWNELY